MRPAILAIGERYNQPLYEPDDRDSFELRKMMGVYNYGSRAAFLKRMGVRWTHGINLLWPHPVPGTWDALEAKRVAAVLRPHIEKYDRVILFGKKVCDAFDVPFKVGTVFGRFIPLPHPVGSSKLWNKQFIKEILE